MRLYIYISCIPSHTIHPIEMKLLSNRWLQRDNRNASNPHRRLLFYFIQAVILNSWFTCSAYWGFWAVEWTNPRPKNKDQRNVVPTVITYNSSSYQPKIISPVIKIKGFLVLTFGARLTQSCFKRGLIKLLENVLRKGFLRSQQRQSGQIIYIYIYTYPSISS